MHPLQTDFPCILPTHYNENSIYVSFFWELRGLSPNFHAHSCVCERFIYSQDLSTYTIFCSRTGRSIVWIYKSLTYTWICKLGPNCDVGLWPRNSFSGNIASNFRYRFFAVQRSFSLGMQGAEHRKKRLATSRLGTRMSPTFFTV